MVGSVTQARLHTQNPPGVTTVRIELPTPTAQPSPFQPAHDNARGYEELAGKWSGARPCDRRSASRRLYRGLEKAGEVASNPESAGQFLSFSGAREISEHPKVVALRNDWQMMELIASGHIFRAHEKSA